jgi:hypothetical protein
VLSQLPGSAVRPSGANETELTASSCPCELDSELEASQHTGQVELHPNLADLYRRKVIEPRNILNDETTRTQAVDIIRALIDHVEIIPSKKRGQCEVVVVGPLAQFLAFAQQKTTAGSSGDDGTFLMVAGACNHRELTLPPVPI